MSDFDGSTLVFRDGIERQFWGAVYAAEQRVASGVPYLPQAYGTYETLDAAAATAADKAVVEMRIRQKSVLHYEGTGARFCCAVCLNSLINEGGELAPHINGCPLGPPWDV